MHLPNHVSFRCGLPVALLAILVTAISHARPPNIVVILADDLGWADTGFAGSDFYETPHLDRLRAQGMAFTQAYAGAGNCAPSRASLWSGQYSPRHGVYAVGSTVRGPRELMRLDAVPNRPDLAPEIETLAEALRGSGYATGLFGKWHLANSDDPSRVNPATLPAAQGFDTFVDTRADRPNRRRDDAPDDPKGAFSLTAAAVDFITAHRARPFFAFVSHHAPHSDLESRPASLARFSAKPPGKIHRDPLYAACIYDLDAAVGRLLAHLDTLGLSEKTIVIFTSDNGGGDSRSQAPLRGTKGTYYEGGLRVPLIMRWPGVVAPDSASAVPVIQLDLFPTFLALAGAAKIPSRLDGADLTPLLKGAPEAALNDRPLFWHFPGYLDGSDPKDPAKAFRARPTSVIRRGDWKLHLHHEPWLLDGGAAGLPSNGATELFHLADDVGELQDLSADRPAERDALLKTLLEWLRTTGAPLPRTR
ncbi:MAG: sulfatase [Opitutaceae bacterium]|nr:sulfatase [Opitutaceae bacterium]